VVACQTFIVTVLEPGVKPVPDTPTVPTPAIACAAAKVMAGADKIVKVTLAVLPDASVTAIATLPAACAAVMFIALFTGMLPAVSVVMLVADACVTVLYHCTAVPPKVTVIPELAANPAPLIGTIVGARTAVSMFVFNVVLKVMLAFTVNEADAAAEPAVTVMV